MSKSEIGRYQVLGELGQGGMAVVFLARDPYMNRQVAVKVLSYRLTSDAMYESFFQREAEVIAALEHPCIVPVFDYGRHGSQPYMVMRYMAGDTLRARLDSGDLKLAELARIVGRVAEGLDAAHAHGIVHRDVKPSNVLFDGTGQAYLADFGLAITAHQAGRTFAGTPAYMSPEQVRDEPLDGRSDVYALGAMLYRLLARRLPYDHESPMVVASSHLDEPVPSLRQARPDLPSAWDEIVAKAMAKDPADRYATAGRLARDVREAASGRWYLRKLAYD